jgi:hypothetical protein
MSLTVVPNKYFGISGSTAGLWLGGTLNVAQSCLCYLTVDATVGAPNWAKVGPHNFTFMKYDDTGKLNFVFRFLESNCNCAAAIGPLPTDSAALHYTGWVDPSTSKELQLHPEHFQVVFNSVGAYPDGLAHPDGLPIGSLHLISVGPGVTG